MTPGCAVSTPSPRRPLGASSRAVVVPSIRPRRSNQEEDTVALTTDDQALTTEAPAAPAPATARPSPRRVAALAWVGAGVGVAAVAALSIAALRDDDRPAKTDDNARTVIEHGSIAALDHRLDVAQAQRTPAETVAEHGSVAAADHQARWTRRRRGRSPSTPAIRTRRSASRWCSRSSPGRSPASRAGDDCCCRDPLSQRGRRGPDHAVRTSAPLSFSSSIRGPIRVPV